MNRILILAVFLFAVSCQSANTKKEAKQTTQAEFVEVTFQVEGMTCTNCENSIVKGVNELEGIKTVAASFADSTAVVAFDINKTSREDIVNQIKKRGYIVKGSD